MSDQKPNETQPVSVKAEKVPSPKKSTRSKIRLIAFGGIFSALILVATYFLMIPLPGKGYIHLGDGVIFIAAMVIGPFAGIPAAIGSALADLSAGYTIYIPATLVIKGGMGAFAGLMLRKGKWKRIMPHIIIFAIAELFMVGGYFVYEWLVFSLQIGAANILPNIFQGISGAAIGAVCVPALLRFRNAASDPVSKN